MIPYPQGKIGTISKLHCKVVHGSDFTDQEYFQESRKIAKLSDSALNLVCSDCFPLMEKRPVYPIRSAAKYSICQSSVHPIGG